LLELLLELASLDRERAAWVAPFGTADLPTGEALSRLIRDRMSVHTVLFVDSRLTNMIGMGWAAPLASRATAFVELRASV
jgi:hypothetical protein